MEWVWRADGDGLRRCLIQEFAKIREGPDAESFRKRGCTLQIAIADGDEFGFRQIAQRSRMDLADLAATDERRANPSHRIIV
jgi:hypothetical protein